MKNKYYNRKRCELNDAEIINDLKNAIDDYENGEILEVQSTLYAIAGAIQDFSNDVDNDRISLV